MYIKDKDFVSLIKNDMERVFIRPYFIQTNESAIVSLYESKSLDMDDIKLVDFLYTNHYATLEQMERVGAYYKIENVKERLSALFKSSIVNKLGFTTESDKKLPGNALLVYCLADGGKHLLKHYTTREVVTWDTSSVCQLPSVISEYLVYNEMVLAFMFNKKLPLATYEVNPKFFLRGDVLIPTGHSQFRKGDQVLYVLSDVIHADMDVLELRKHLRILETLVTTQIWKRYYPDSANAPIVVFIVDNDDAALALSKEIHQSCRVRDFRLTTPERMNGPLGRSGAFLKFDEMNNCMVEVKVDVFDE